MNSYNFVFPGSQERLNTLNTNLSTWAQSAMNAVATRKKWGGGVLKGTKAQVGSFPYC